MSDYSYIKEYVYPLDAHNSPYSYGYANYIGNNKIIASCYKNRLFVFNIKTFQVETTVIFHMKGYRIYFFKLLRNGNIITADYEGKLFYIDEQYKCNVIQNNVNTQKTLDIVFINEHQFVELCAHDSIHIWSY